VCGTNIQNLLENIESVESLSGAGGFVADGKPKLELCRDKIGAPSHFDCRKLVVQGFEEIRYIKRRKSMRKSIIGLALLFFAPLGGAETVTTAQDYAVDSDVVLESAVREIKSVPRDTVNLIGDAAKMVGDETATAVKGVASVFKADPVAVAEQSALLEVSRAWNSANDILFRSYEVSEPVGIQLSAGKVPSQGDGVDVSVFFNGIEFPEGTSAVYRPEFKRLFVRQTFANILAIEDVLARQRSRSRKLMGEQVEIHAKFIEVNQSTLNELGFNWRFDGNPSAADSVGIFEDLALPAGQDVMATGLRTASGALRASANPGDLLVQKNAGSLRWSLIITALEQSDGADVLSAPRITTRNGKTAGIWIGEQRMVPKSFSAENKNTSVCIENSNWKSELVGVQLEVTPELRKDALIDLKLKPKVTDLIGYDDYEITPANASIQMMAAGNTLLSRFGNLANVFSSANYANNAYSINTNNTYFPSYNMQAIPVPSQHGRLPYFRLREITTKVTVADGSTVGMGGLIYDKLETYKDKVPVLGSIPLLGRLFRSEGERSVKRNLMIFVTATQVDVNGRRAADLVMQK
jgi:Flp pilus assembly secretin CpaC